MVNGLAFVAHGDSGIVVIDVSNPAAPVLRGSAANMAFAWDLEITNSSGSDPLLYIADRDGGLSIWRVWSHD